MMQRALIALLLFAASLAPSLPVAAEDDEAPRTRVLVLGDAIGGGLGAGLARVAEPGGRYEVSIRFNEESGLARPEVYDWVATVPKILESNPYDVIVVMIGANDTQPVRFGDARVPFNAEGWAEAYGARLDRLLDELAASGARVFWAGLPPMRDPDYDASVQVIAALQRQRVEARGFAFVSLRPSFLASDGSYTDMGPDEAGMVTRLRGRDGVSFYKAGNNRMAQIVLAAIQSGASGVAVGGDGGSDPGTAGDIRLVPLFGQTLMDGEVHAVRPEGVTANAVILAGSGLDPAAALNALRDLSPPGSGAEKLFRYGYAPAAPAGRADDFSAPLPVE